MSDGRTKSMTVPLTSQLAVMMAQNFVNQLVYIHSVFTGMHLGKRSNRFIPGLTILPNINSQQTNKIWKTILSFFKSIDFKIEITTNLTQVNFLDVTFNLEYNTDHWKN